MYVASSFSRILYNSKRKYRNGRRSNILKPNEVYLQSFYGLLGRFFSLNEKILMAMTSLQQVIFDDFYKTSFLSSVSPRLYHSFLAHPPIKCILPLNQLWSSPYQLQSSILVKKTQWCLHAGHIVVSSTKTYFPDISDSFPAL